MEKAPTTRQKPLPPSRSNSTTSAKYLSSRQSSRNWEVMDDPRNENSVGSEQDLPQPEMQQGYILKKRKWPLKGWHKRYFILDKGILRYAKTQQDINKGKLHGSIDVSLSVMSINKKSKRIDLDAEDNLYHLKVKSQEAFSLWVSCLHSHRVFRKNDPARLHNGVFQAMPDALNYSKPHRATLQQGSAPNQSSCSVDMHIVDGKVSAWLQQTSDMQTCSIELSKCQADLNELSRLLQDLDMLHRVSSAPVICNNQNSSSDRPKKEKRTSKIWCAKNLTKEGTVAAMGNAGISSRWHASVPSLPDCLGSEQHPSAFTLPADFSQLQRDFCCLAQKVHTSLKSAFDSLSLEKERLQKIWQDPHLRPSPIMHTANFRNTLSEMSAQNMDLQDQLTRIHSLSVSSDSTADSFVSLNQEEQASPCGSGQVLKHQLSVGSSVSLSDSHAEYFDACEVILCGSSSENEGSDADSCASDITNSNSEEHLENFSKAPITCVTSALSSNSGNMPKSQEGPGRRTCLPAPGPNTSNISLWNIMRNNIGKDLSRVSMPVQLNEPMNTLQKLCEELEYSEVLDRANQTQDPFERMVYIAAFAISAYASAFHRSGSKPFNPVLGETYECERLDKGFRFISEQVSHHPPISVCHAESDNFIFWQDVRWKNKFWGKSMEIVPIGMVNVTLKKFGDHYEWNKVTSCIHNILSTQRWIEHYGEVIIRNTKSSICHCKITFCKSKYWSSNMNEVQGAVLDESGNVIHRLGGRWHEGLYCGSPPKTHCIWKPNAMPVDFDRYYGFTKFALELNEITPELKTLLPPTDTRLRPDQRYLEEGNLEAAETHKHRVEQLQRERRQVLEENGVLHQPRFFTRTVDASGKEIWFSNGTYWKQRKDPGFHKMDNAVLW
ncbi:oxysterol-binding protein-related protein 7 [Polypterus senegalus]|uniref:oxysterol-binding protein-related protein 7 n=1 Tax=Polypterus senegalus TaxID=55291 RepID=UPI001964A5B0|nr:oxysterol-binding protein-related protein 7 [Polypterus senegalus]XP_039595277.1 oxysterol-binding protein-related protein 7 [Polypterus senegalus]XP_039595278.1 oxysterol-binding protein-related protein 7 [Polypterus senegalus]